MTIVDQVNMEDFEAVKLDEGEKINDKGESLTGPSGKAANVEPTQGMSGTQNGSWLKWRSGDANQPSGGNWKQSEI